jgi:5-methylthioadenosine/S-adenosylhomocysteine deaminase
MTDAQILIEGGTILSMDEQVGDLQTGDVLLEGNRIAAVAEEIPVEGDVERIDARGAIVMPGLIDPHRHLWYSAIRGLGMDATLDDMVNRLWPQLAANYGPDDLYTATRAGAIDALDHGITTVLDWCHVVNTPEHAPEAVRALRGLPLRTVFAYGASMRRKLDEYIGETEHRDSWAPARRLRQDELYDDTARVTMALALQGPEFTTLDITRADVGVARDLDVPMTMHCGIPAGPSPARAIGRLFEAGLLGSDMQFVHCCTTLDEEFAQLAVAGGTSAACPLAELTMGMGQPPIGRMRDAGLPAAVGADAVSCASGDLFDEARAAMLAERGLQARLLIQTGAAVEAASQLGFTTREALESITIAAARSCWLADRVGSITIGKAADIIMLRGAGVELNPLSDVVGTVVSAAHARNVDTVIVDGQIVKRDGQLVDLDLAAVRLDLDACRDRLFDAGGFAVPAYQPEESR